MELHLYMSGKAGTASTDVELNQRFQAPHQISGHRTTEDK